MWKLLIIVVFILIALWFVLKKKKEKMDKTSELIDHKIISDMEYDDMLSESELSDDYE